MGQLGGRGGRRCASGSRAIRAIVPSSRCRCRHETDDCAQLFAARPLRTPSVHSRRDMSAADTWAHKVTV